ncbi:predicted protein [Micromonas commoda]|uniref:Uncharacterized protein n=1 Tax=Micromonas commoda (strain RCC299 / NOUM17 / CCMP2709) TaxID=296587 RepID=C1E4Q3_MICCC|nr:predicted protein [Micromonas commoda]ACO63160.1 predicted protein [Micromonas commoda]|eukprot:XP_002501902.1 predicted protein [Micromonas commoda]
MGPKAAAAAVEIDPRLLRQLEEEYESLKSTSAGAPVDFASWIKRRLREAKSSGLIRIAKTTPPAKPAAKKAPASAKPGPSMGHAPRPIASSTPALAPARYDPNRYTRGADTPADAPHAAEGGGTVFKAAPAPAPARTPERRPTPVTTADPPTPADEFSPSVFQPPSSGGSGSAAARSHRGGRPIAVTWASSDELSDENVQGFTTMRVASNQPGPALEDVKRSAAAAASAARRAQRDPAAPWFGRDGAMAPSGFYLGGRYDRRVLDPGHHPATVRGVGDKVRRMARASALAQRDMSKRTDRESLETPIGGSYSLLLDLQASEQERVAKERELSAVRRRERALFAKNKELEETLSAQASKAAEADEKIARAKREAQKAQAELVRAIERQRAEDRRVFERRSGRVGDDRNVRGSSPVTGVERRFLAGVDEAPQTLKEAAARFLGDARKLHEAELNASLDLDPYDAHGTSQRTSLLNGKPPSGPSFLERMKERQRRAAARRAEKAFRERVEREALGHGPARKPGWDDSPDVVVRIGGEPAPERPRSAPGTARPPGSRTPPKKGTYGGGRGAPPPKKMSVAAMRQRQADERRARGLEPLADPKPRTPPPGQKRKKATAPRPQSAPQSARKLLDSGPLLDPGSQPATGLFAMNPAARLGNANPKDEIAAMRTILDEVVAHLRLLHVATGGRSGSAAASVRAAAEAISALPESPDAPAAKYSRTLRSGGGRLSPHSSAAKSPSDKGKKGKVSGAAAASSSPGVPSRREVTAAMNAARLSGKLVLDSLDHSKALEMLRDVENNETALRAKWGLFSPDHPPPQGAEELALSYAERRARGIPADAAVTASGDLIPLGQTNDGPSGAGDAGDVGVESTRTAAVDADTVARVWEARNQYARWQAALDDGVADVSSPNGEGFSPCEVHEEIAERLLDALLADVARELGDACDEATQIVLRHEFSSAANSIDASSVGGDDDDSNILVIADGGTTTPPRNGLGAYDGATPAAMDVTLGAAMARVGLSPEEASAEIVEEEDLGVH